MPTAGSEQLAAASRQQQLPVRKPVTALDVLNETIVKSLKPATVVNEEKPHHAPPPTAPTTTADSNQPHQDRPDVRSTGGYAKTTGPGGGSSSSANTIHSYTR